MNPHEILEAARARRKDAENAVHKVKNIDEVDEKKLKWPAIVQMKYDGVYCAVIVSGGKAMPVSRTLRPLMNIEHLMVPARFARVDGVYIAELVNSSMALEVLSGTVNPNRVEPLSPEMEAAMVRHSALLFHDFLTIDEFVAGNSHAQYQHRWKYLGDDALAPCLFSGYAIARAVTVQNLQSFENIAERYIEVHGAEGAVLKQLDAEWIAGKKDHQYAKRVRELHVDLQCLNVEYGKGKRTSQIAKLQFEYNGKSFWADLGKGWTDELRDQLTAQFEFDAGLGPIGKIFHVKALQESSKGVLRLPKVQEMRIDKEIQDGV